MGGKYEDTIEKKPRAAGTVGKIRFHETGGEVHFHDDDAKRKVAMPVHIWSEAWMKLSSGEWATWGYIDIDTKCALVVALTAEQGKIEADVRIDEAVFGPAFEKLQRFTEQA